MGLNSVEKMVLYLKCMGVMFSTNHYVNVCHTYILVENNHVLQVKFCNLHADV